MKSYILASLAIVALSACEPQKITKNNQKANQAAEAVAAEDKANKEKVRQETQQKAEHEKKELEAKAHFSQAFSYLGAAKAATVKEEKERLLLNAETELSNALSKKDDYAEALMNRGVVYIALGKFNKAEEDLKKAVSIEPANAGIHYNLSCVYALTNKLDLAIDSLDAALKNGFNNADRLRSDPDLQSLRKTKQFRQTLEKHKIFIF